MSRNKILNLAVMLTLFFTALPALADNWTATKLRGKVFVFTQGSWVQLSRGDVVSDDRVIRTLPSGRVSFQRDGEVIELSPNSQIQIIDRNGRRFTTVSQSYGRVAIEAEVQNVQHFAVKNQFMVATVKGTRFQVWADEDGAGVDVDRGRVEVRDTVHKLLTTVVRGQRAQSGGDTPLRVSGAGDIAEIRSTVGAQVVVVAKNKNRGDDKGKSSNGRSGNDRSNNDDGNKDKSNNSGSGNDRPNNDNGNKGKSNNGRSGNDKSDDDD